jgi:hypothetical protein
LENLAETEFKDDTRNVTLKKMRARPRGLCGKRAADRRAMELRYYATASGYYRLETTYRGIAAVKLGGSTDREGLESETLISFVSCPVLKDGRSEKMNSIAYFVNILDKVYCDVCVSAACSCHFSLTNLLRNNL